MSALEIVAADTLPAANLHAATVAAFADYLVGPFQITLEQFASFIGRQGVDLAGGQARIALARRRLPARVGGVSDDEDVRLLEEGGVDRRVGVRGDLEVAALERLGRACQ